MTQEFHLKIVFTRLYVFICLVLLLLIFSGVANSFFRNGKILTGGLILFTVVFIYYNKKILTAWFTRNMTIFISDNNILLFEKEEKKITYTFNELVKSQNSIATFKE